MRTINPQPKGLNFAQNQIREILRKLASVVRIPTSKSAFEFQINSSTRSSSYFSMRTPRTSIIEANVHYAMPLEIIYAAAAAALACRA